MRIKWKGMGLKRVQHRRFPKRNVGGGTLKKRQKKGERGNPEGRGRFIAWNLRVERERRKRGTNVCGGDGKRGPLATTCLASGE